ncbi:uncharacterized protein METZ01_LOCUS366754, partial [marine metagenome]
DAKQLEKKMELHTHQGIFYLT